MNLEKHADVHQTSVKHTSHLAKYMEQFTGMQAPSGKRLRMAL